MILNILAFLFAVGLGVGMCYMGYRIFLVLLPVWGFFAGLWFGGFAVAQFLGSGFFATTSGWVVGVILGVIAAVVSYYIFLAGVALVAAAIGATLSYGVMTTFMEANFIVGIITLVIAVIFAVLTLRHNLQKYAIAALTALAGADIIVLLIFVLLGVVHIADIQVSGNLIELVTGASWLAWIGWMALAASGIYVQVVYDKGFEFTKERYVESWG